jgi:hypothetical protein
VNDTTATYDGQQHTVTINGTQTKDGISYSLTGAAGSYVSDISYKDVTAAQKVYVEVTRSGFAPYFGYANVIVNPAPLTVTANDEVVTYGDAAPTYSASYAGFVNGENPSALGGTLAIGSSYAKNSAVGSYPITIGGLTSNNYTITFVNGTLKVNAAPIAVYRVAFVNYDGTLLKVEWVDANSAALAPANPTRPGYRFIGWNTSFDKVTNHMTITALFTPVAAAAAAPAAQPTVLPSQSAPAAAPSVSPSASVSSETTVIPSQSAPAAAPSTGALAQTGGGFPWWAWIIIAAAVAVFLIWLFGFKRRKREQH